MTASQVTAYRESYYADQEAAASDRTRSNHGHGVHAHPSTSAFNSVLRSYSDAQADPKAGPEANASSVNQKSEAAGKQPKQNGLANFQAFSQALLGQPLRERVAANPADAALPHPAPVTKEDPKHEIKPSNSVHTPKNSEPSAIAPRGKAATPASAQGDADTPGENDSAALPGNVAAASSIANTEVSKPAEADSTTSSTDESPALPQTNAASGLSSAAQATGELALAVKVEPGTTRQPAQSASLSGSQADFSGAAGVPMGAAITPADRSRTSPENFNADGGAQSEQKSFEKAVAQTTETAAAQGTPETHAAKLEAELEKYRNEPVRGVHVQLSSGENQRVDIRMTERAGQLSVTVRSADAELTRALQSSAAELNGNLRVDHYRTETWTPNSGAGSQSNDRESRSSFSGREGSAPGGSPDGQSNARQNQSRQEQRPQWVRDAEKSGAEIQKRIEYTWQA